MGRRPGREKTKGRGPRRRERADKDSVDALVKKFNKKLPIRTKIGVAKAGRLFDPYEGFARDMWSERGSKLQSEGIALGELLVVDGVAGPQMTAHLQEAADAAQRQMSKLMLPLARERDTARMQQVQHMIYGVYENAGMLIARNGRPLMVQAYREIIQELDRQTIALSIEVEKAQGNSPKGYLEFATSAHASDGAIEKKFAAEQARWALFALDVQSGRIQFEEAEETREKMEAQSTEYTEFLMDEELKPGYYRFELPNVQIDGQPVTIRFVVDQDQHPFKLGRVELYSQHRAHRGKHIAVGELSRINGEITALDTFFLSLQKHIESNGAAGRYAELRHAVLEAVTNGIMDGHIPTVSDTVELTSGGLVSRSVEPEPVAEEVSQQVVEEVPFELPADVPVSAEAFESEHIVQADEPAQQEVAPRRVVKRLRRLTHRRAVRALRRLGVEVSGGGKHLKMEFNGNSTAFLNTHSGENTHTLLRVLKQTLQNLQIVEEDFWEKLK